MIYRVKISRTSAYESASRAPNWFFHDRHIISNVLNKRLRWHSDEIALCLLLPILRRIPDGISEAIRHEKSEN